MRLVQPQIGQEVAVFKEIDHQVVDDLRVDGADARIGELHAPERLALLRVVAVFSEIGDDVGDAHHAPLKGGGNERPDAGGVFAARRHAGVEFRKVRKGSGAVFAHLQFPVVGGDAVQRLQREVERENFVQHAHGVQVVRKMQPRMRKIQLVQKALARVPERGMPDVVPQGDRLDEFAVEPQRPPQRARRARDELNVQAAARQVVIFIEGEHLRLVGAAAVIGAVEDLVRVADKGGAPDVRRIVRVGVAAAGARIVEGIGIFCAARAVGFHAPHEGGGEFFIVCHAMIIAVFHKNCKPRARGTRRRRRPSRPLAGRAARAGSGAVRFFPCRD